MPLIDPSIDDLKFLLPDYLEKYHNINNLKHFFHCFNPEHIDRHPSMRYYEKGNVCKCFSCDVSYDIFDLVGIDYGLTSFKDKISKVKELYLNYVPQAHEKKEQVDEKLHDYSKYYKKCYNNRYKSDYLLSRGISRELIEKYHIGYDERYKQIVIPINKNCYFARSVISNFKYKNPGRSDIWNKELLYENNINNHIYVTEGIIDSLSLEMIDPNIKTISINGVGNIYSLVDAIKESNYNGIIIIAFDEDYGGITASKKLKEELTKINVNSFSVSLSSSNECNDINDLLIHDKSKLENNLKSLEQMLSPLINNLNNKKGEEFCLE